MTEHKMDCNCCNCIWDRILSFTQNNNNRPTGHLNIFKTKKKIEFWLEKVNSNTIRPINSKESVLFNISKEDISKDILKERGGKDGLVSVFGSPAPSYRYALLNDLKIWK